MKTEIWIRTGSASSFLVIRSFRANNSGFLSKFVSIKRRLKRIAIGNLKRIGGPLIIFKSTTTFFFFFLVNLVFVAACCSKVLSKEQNG